MAWQRWFLFVGLGGLVLCIYIFPRYTLGLLSEFLVVTEKPERADAVVIVPTAETVEPVQTAYLMYKRGLGKEVVLGTGYQGRWGLRRTSRIEWLTVGRRYKLALKSLGVKEMHITMVNTELAGSEEGELAAIARYGAQHSWSRVILVTSALASRRIGLIWSRVSPEIVHFTVSAREPGVESWWRHTDLTRQLVEEYGALLKEAFFQLFHVAAEGRHLFFRLQKDPSADNAKGQ